MYGGDGILVLAAGGITLPDAAKFVWIRWNLCEAA
jgi:hypothetical protein